jgi:hypothetical protein
LHAIGQGAQRSLDHQVLAAHESGAFGVVMQTLERMAQTGTVEALGAAPLRQDLDRLRSSFALVMQSLKEAAAPVALAPAQAAEYQAFSQSLRDMALLEATMQSVAESGQRVLQRLTQGRDLKSAG